MKYLFHKYKFLLLFYICSFRQRNVNWIESAQQVRSSQHFLKKLDFFLRRRIDDKKSIMTRCITGRVRGDFSKRRMKPKLCPCCINNRVSTLASGSKITEKRRVLAFFSQEKKQTEPSCWISFCLSGLCAVREPAIHSWWFMDPKHILIVTEITSTLVCWRERKALLIWLVTHLHGDGGRCGLDSRQTCVQALTYPSDDSAIQFQHTYSQHSC